MLLLELPIQRPQSGQSPCKVVRHGRFCAGTLRRSNAGFPLPEQNSIVIGFPCAPVICTGRVVIRSSFVNLFEVETVLNFGQIDVDSLK